MLRGFGIKMRGAIAARFGDVVGGGEINELFLTLGDVAIVDGKIGIDESEGTPSGSTIGGIVMIWSGGGFSVMEAEESKKENKKVCHNYIITLGV